jgi:tetratricopeptide (TPR) repeat protein
MAEVYAAHLDDPEAALFYALALLASADPRDKSYTHQFKSAALLNWVKQTQPTHPGVLHYLIHSFDFPGLAHLALREATIYAETAPDSAHAQHMPSHIFTRLGLWERSLASNQDSTRSAEAYAHRAKLHGHYDEGLHSMDYLLYAMLQTARDEEARRLLNELRDIKATNTENFKVAYAYAAGPARFALERRQWSEAANLELMRQDFPWNDFGWALSIHHFGRGIGAARSGQVERARESLQRIKALQQTQPTDTLPYWREQMGVHLDAIAAWVALAEGDEATAISLARQAAEQEDAVDKHPVTPSEVLPARELYADLLLQTGRAADALAEYQSLLQAYPNRLNALLGAGYAAESIGDNNLARAMYATAVRQAQPGNPDRDGLARARAALD